MKIKIDAAIGGWLAGVGASCGLTECLKTMESLEQGLLSAEVGTGTSAGTGLMLDKTFIGKFKFSSDFLSNIAARFVTGLITDQNAVTEIRGRYQQEKQFPAIVTIFHNQPTIHSPTTGPQ